MDRLKVVIENIEIFFFVTWVFLGWMAWRLHWIMKAAERTAVAAEKTAAGIEALYQKMYGKAPPAENPKSKEPGPWEPRP